MNNGGEWGTRRMLERWALRAVALGVLMCASPGCDDAGGGASDVPADGTGDVIAAPDVADSQQVVDSDAADTGDAADTLDASPPADVVADTVEPPCLFPAPSLATSAAARAVIDAPARCGQAAYAWLDDAALGDVVEQVPKLSIGAALLTALLAAEGLTPPKAAEHDVKVDQLRYLTQDRGQLIEATALLAYPTNMPADTELDILLFLHGTVGFNDACSPSNETGPQALAALFAAMGYLVVMPDYIGLKGSGEPTGFPHPYLVGVATAMASLDAARAAGKLPAAQKSAICVRPRVAVVGGSQGGHAALWVDRVAAYYAPELELLGVVATVPPADLIAQVTAALLVARSSTANTMAFIPTAGAWYGYADRLDEAFVAPFDVDVAAALANSCSPGDLIPSFATLPEVFQQPLLDAAANNTLAALEPWGCMVAENGLTTTSIPRLGPNTDSYGILTITGEADSLVDTPIERAAIPALCAQGMPMQYLECAGATHTKTTLWALPEIIAFVDARSAGEVMDAASLCQVGTAVQCAGTP